MQHRLVLSWAVATRLQLDRWEALLAEHLRNQFDKQNSAGALIWQAQFEHHFCLIAARNLLRALELSDLSIVVDPIVKAEIADVRNLNEHWDAHMPIFNQQPPPRQPSRAGKAFADRNPETHLYPYWWLDWDNKVGPKLSPNVPAAVVHALLDEVEAQVLREAPEMAVFLLPRPTSPWLEEWWPRPRS